MRNNTKYEKLYQKERDVCGPPFKEFVEFIDSFGRRRSKILDLGCGQGRDALFIARKGHSVLGVDLSQTGVSQMVADAKEEGLDVKGVVADIVRFKPKELYDVVLLDRVLHQLRDDHDRLSVLEIACHCTKPGGFVLIADIPKHMGLLVDFFRQKRDLWQKQKSKKGLLIVQKAKAHQSTRSSKI